RRSAAWDSIYDKFHTTGETRRTWSLRLPGRAPTSHPDRAPDCWLAPSARPGAGAVAFRNRDLAGDGAESARRLSGTPRPSAGWGSSCPDRAGHNRGFGDRGSSAHLHRSIAIVDPARPGRLAIDSR